MINTVAKILFAEQVVHVLGICLASLIYALIILFITTKAWKLLVRAWAADSRLLANRAKKTDKMFLNAFRQGKCVNLSDLNKINGEDHFDSEVTETVKKYETSFDKMVNGELSPRFSYIMEIIRRSALLRAIGVVINANSFNKLERMNVSNENSFEDIAAFARYSPIQLACVMAFLDARKRITINQSSRDSKRKVHISFNFDVGDKRRLGVSDYFQYIRHNN